MPAVPVAAELKEKALIRLLPPYNWSLRQVADEIGTSPATVCKWRKELEVQGVLSLSEEISQSPENWPAERKFTVVLETAALSELSLGEYCRERGLFPEQIKAWKKGCIDGNQATTNRGKRQLDQEAKQDKKRIKELEKELTRKEKALAETAALLVLREKFNALWEKEEDK